MSKVSLIHALALIACTTIMATPALAHSPPGGSGLFGGGGLGLPDFRQCLASIADVHGCLQEIIFSALSLQPKLLGTACCKAFLEIDETCWPKMFPFNLTFPVELRTYCLVVEDMPQPQTPPCSSSSDNEGGDCEDD